MQQPINKFSR